MKITNRVSIMADSASKKSPLYNILSTVAFLCLVFFFGCAFLATNYEEKISSWETIDFGPLPTTQSYYQTHYKDECKDQCRPHGTEPLPKGIITSTSNLEMRPLWGSPLAKEKVKSSKNLLAIPVGIKQKAIVSQIVEKFLSSNFTVMLFHYDSVVDGWRDLPWNDRVLHVSAASQTKWWFAKRFLHPDIAAEYDYIFLWDEDLGVENFDPSRYLSIIEEEGLEISQPALDRTKSQVHHQITARVKKVNVHRRTYKYRGSMRCNSSSTAPPCTGWVEMMAPVFSRAAWHCSWYMIQNDLIHAWGLDYKLGYCAQGDRTKNIGVVDSEYIVHQGIPTLGSKNEDKAQEDARLAVRRQSYIELQTFKRRWEKAVEDDDCWTDPYS